jgi:hypothetical protein
MYSDRDPGELRSNGSKLPAWHYWLYWAGVLCAVAAALTAFGVIGRHSGHSFGRAYDRIASAYHTQFDRGASAGPQIPLRRLYPYSVIPGGVESAQELRNSIANDPLVAALYANFNLSKAHIIRLARDRWVYVSYRLGGHIYWTKKRVLLRAGETLITDGKHEARTRCGNRISETPVQPVSDQEPPSAALNAPPDYTLVAENPGPPPTVPIDPPPIDPTDPNRPPPLQPPSDPPVLVIPPPTFPIVGGGPPTTLFPPPPPPPVATPEPSTIWLLALGLLALGAVTACARNREN